MLRRIEKILRYAALSMLALSVIAFILLNSTRVQHFLLEKITASVNRSLGVQLFFAQARISPWLDIELQGVRAQDEKGDTLIYIERLKTQLSKLNPALGKYYFKDLKIIRPLVTDHLHRGDSSSTLRALLKKWQTPSAENSRLSLRISGDLSIVAGRFRKLDDYRDKPLRFDFQDINLSASKLSYRAQRIQMTLDSASLRETVSGFHLKALSLRAGLSGDSAVLQNLRLETDHSKLRIPSFALPNPRKAWMDLDSLWQNPSWHAELEKSSLGLRDLKFLLPHYDRDTKLQLSGSLSGSPKGLNITHFRLETGHHTRVQADLVLRAEGRDYQMNGCFRQLQTDYQDLTQILPRASIPNIPPEVQRAGLFQYAGTAEISRDYLTLDGALQTDMGKLHIQSDFTNYNSISRARYSGFFTSAQFNIGKLTDNSLFGNAGLDIALDGTGLSKAYFDNEINGEINYLEVGGSRYKDISAKGWIKNKVFQGKVLFKDPAAKLSATVKVDGAGVVYHFDLNALVEHIELGKLKCCGMDRAGALSGRIELHARASSAEDAVGTLSFFNGNYTKAHKAYAFKDLHISSQRDSQGIRRIKIHSPDVINGAIKGNFELAQLLPLAKNALGKAFSHYRRLEMRRGQYLSYAFSLHSEALNALIPNFRLQAGTQISGSLEGAHDRLKLDFSTSGIQYKGNEAVGLAVHIDTKPGVQNAIAFDKARIRGVALYDFETEARFAQDTVFFQTRLNLGKPESNSLLLKGAQTLSAENALIVKLSKFDLDHRQGQWAIDSQKTDAIALILDPERDSYSLSDCALRAGNARLSASGRIQGEDRWKLNIKAEEVKLRDFTADLEPVLLGGAASGMLDIQRKGEEIHPKLKIQIRDFKFNRIPYGALRAEVTQSEGKDSAYTLRLAIGDGIDQKLGLKTRLFRDATGRFACDGKLELKAFDARFLNHFLEEVLEFQGQLEGAVDFSGPLEDPLTEGVVYGRHLELFVPYTQVHYTLPNRILVGVSRGKLIIPPTEFRDPKSPGMGTLQGELYQKRFSKWMLNLNAQADKLLVLHTSEADNPDYFGTAFATGSADFHGLEDDLNIDVNASTDENTYLNIPMSGDERIARADFIRFILPEPDRSKEPPKEEKSSKDRGKLNFHMNLELTEAARVKISFEEMSGSYLIGSGKGNLEMRANSYGDFNLYGNYEVHQGTYNFNFNDFISKRFSLEKGGTLNWNGDPYKAALNADARYETRVSNLGEYLNNQTLNGNIDVALEIQLLGSLNNPDYNFQILLPQARQATRAALCARMQSEDEEIEQFAYILATRKFKIGSLNPRAGLAGNATEVLLNQLGNVFSSISDKVDVGLEYAQGDPLSSTSDEFEVNVTTQLNDRITLKTDLGIPLGENKRSPFSSELEVLYDLNRKKTLKLSVFNRLDAVEGLSARVGSYKQGIGIQYSRSFDSFARLGEKIFGKKDSSAVKGPAAEKKR